MASSIIKNKPLHPNNYSQDRLRAMAEAGYSKADLIKIYEAEQQEAIVKPKAVKQGLVRIFTKEFPVVNSEIVIEASELAKYDKIKGP
ncbi:hypothetical protein LCGC14_2271670 [marine sediment metagenome]|uniref:Uncharacterized protein n=1 Tax=marine sediment metagenome TaxID=412755 RepID=A0A0F9F9A6_9ZZZZ